MFDEKVVCANFALPIEQGALVGEQQMRITTMKIKIGLDVFL